MGVECPSGGGEAAARRDREGGLAVRTESQPPGRSAPETDGDAAEPAPQPPEPRCHLVVRLGPHHVAFDAEQVVEVFPLGPLARVPRAPAWLLGVVQHQGRPLPVVDLALHTGLSATAAGGMAVLLDHTEVPLAVRVEAVEAVEASGDDANAVPAPPAAAPTPDRPRWPDAWHPAGVASAARCAGDGRRYHLLDAERVIDAILGVVGADGSL